MQLKISYNSCDSNGLELYFYTCYKMLLVIRKLQLRTEVMCMSDFRKIRNTFEHTKVFRYKMILFKAILMKMLLTKVRSKKMVLTRITPKET